MVLSAPSLRAALAASFFGVVTLAGAESEGLARHRVHSHGEAFAEFDKDRNNNLSSVERDGLRLAFKYRNDLHFLDLNRDGKLQREEIDVMEAGRFQKDKKEEKAMNDRKSTKKGKTGKKAKKSKDERP